jgi:hypothetical protein
VTICAGFHCSEGIVLCADTQETVEGVVRRNVPKLELRPSADIFIENEPHAIFAGAGDSDLIENLIDRIWTAMTNKSTLDDMIQGAQEELFEAYAQLSSAYQVGYLPEATFLIGVWCPPHDVELIRVRGPVLVRRIPLDAIGCGTILSTYITNRLAWHKSSFSEVVPACLYMLDEVKNYVEGCGGDTHLATLRYDGKIEFLAHQTIEENVIKIREIEHIGRDIIAISLGQDCSDDMFQEAMNDYAKRLKEVRLKQEQP